MRMYNRLTGESMERPEYPRASDYYCSDWYSAYYAYLSDMKVWDAFVEACSLADFVPKHSQLKHATERGVSVPRTGVRHRRKYKNGSGVSANSRILPHRYADEGEKGSGHRREIRRVERAQWLSEWQEENNSPEAMSPSLWFAGYALWWENDFGMDWEPYDDWCETCGGPCDL